MKPIHEIQMRMNIAAHIVSNDIPGILAHCGYSADSTEAIIRSLTFGLGQVDTAYDLAVEGCVPTFLVEDIANVARRFLASIEERESELAAWRLAFETIEAARATKH